MTLYLSVDLIKDIHEKVIDRYGGAHGIRDERGIISAIGRLETGYYSNIIAEASALMESLAINHPFIDGNKRTALGSVDAFLKLNGYRLDGDSKKIHQHMIKLFEDGNFKLNTIDDMLRKYTKPL